MKLVGGNTEISSYFSLWKLDYFSDIAFLKNIFDTRKILDGKPLMFFFLNPANDTEFFPMYESQVWIQDVFYRTLTLF